MQVRKEGGRKLVLKNNRGTLNLNTETFRKVEYKRRWKRNAQQTGEERKMPR